MMLMLPLQKRSSLILVKNICGGSFPIIHDVLHMLLAIHERMHLAPLLLNPHPFPDHPFPLLVFPRHGEEAKS
jgi:hypothetical protein